MIARTERIDHIYSTNGAVKFDILKRTLRPAHNSPHQNAPRVTFKITMEIYEHECGYFEGPDINSMYDWATEQLKTPISFFMIKYA